MDQHQKGVAGDAHYSNKSTLVPLLLGIGKNQTKRYKGLDRHKRPKLESLFLRFTLNNMVLVSVRSRRLFCVDWCPLGVLWLSVVRSREVHGCVLT